MLMVTLFTFLLLVGEGTVLASAFGERSGSGFHGAGIKGCRDCLATKNVPVVLTTATNYADYSKPYNLRLEYAPDAIVIPTTSKHIADALSCARANGVKVQPKSGGHSYASYSMGGQNGSLIIDLEQLQEITVDSKGVAKVGGGVRLGNLALGIYNSTNDNIDHLRGLPHGTCPG
jgi:FAD binding domain